MKICWENNVWPFYLLPHTSHITQPLDLSCFSFVKSKYRQAIADLASLEDSAPIKKLRFIQYYAAARETGLSSDHIKSGWKASGIYPWNPQKVLPSRQVRQSTTKQPTTVTTGPSTPARVDLDSAIVPPMNSRHLRAQINALSQSDRLSRSTRLLFSKTTKTLGALEFAQTNQTLEIQKQSKVIEDYNAKKRRKVTVDSNETFASIGQIIEAQRKIEANEARWNAIDRASEARKQADEMTKQGIAPFLVEWHAG